jgi:hypothetical protein
MALTPNFDRIVATITDADVQRFLRSAAPDDDKQRVKNATSDEVRMRLVGGYMIRTNQITAARLKPTGSSAALAAKKPAKRRATKVQAANGSTAL